MANPKLLLISGSLRKGSYNRMLLAEAAEAFGPAEISEGSLDLPLYNGDLEEAEGVPEAVKHLAQQIKEADAVVIGAPEYNKGITGVLKNGLDWISRVPGAAFKDKPVVVVSASAGRTGGETGHFNTIGILHQLQVNVVHGPLILVAAAQNEFDADGNLTNDFLKGQVADRMERLRGMLG